MGAAVRFQESSLLDAPRIFPQTLVLRVRWGSGAPVSLCVSKFGG